MLCYSTDDDVMKILCYGTIPTYMFLNILTFN